MELLGASCGLPFCWKGKDHKIKSWGIKNDLAYAEVEPENTELVDVLKRRIEKDRGLIVYLGPGYICFVEDYPQH